MKSKFKKAGRMKTMFFITISCIGWLCLLSCGKTYCPAFPEHLVDYFPYNKGDTLLFVNQNNDSILFIVDTVEKTENYSFGWGCGCECEKYFMFAARVNNRASINGNIHLIERSKICINLNDGYFDGATSTSSFLYFEKTEKETFDPKNSALFGEIVILEDENKQISWVTIVKGNGITEFYDKKYDFHWKNINKNK